MVFDTTVLVGTPISSGDVFLVDEERHLVKTRICGNCKWWNEVKELPEFGYCQHPDMPAYVQGGLIDPVRNTFGCEPLFEEKESEGEGA